MKEILCLINIKRRLQEHKRWCTETINLKIWNFELLWYFEFKEEKEARKYEKKIKKNGHYDRLEHRDSFIKAN